MPLLSKQYCVRHEALRTLPLAQHLQAERRSYSCAWPSLFVLIGNAERSATLQTLFGVKKARWPLTSRTGSEMHLHLDPTTAFVERPILLASYDARQRSVSRTIGRTIARPDKCHKETRHVLRQLPSSEQAASDDVLPRLLGPFADVFCFFSDDLGGFRQIAQCLARWLDQGCSPSLPNIVRPSVLVVTSGVVTSGADKAKSTLLSMLAEETTVDLHQQFADIDVLVVFPKKAVSAEARWRPLRERLMKRSDRMRIERKARRVLYSATHLAAFLQSAGPHFARNPSDPFYCIQASRAHNPVAPDLAEHHSTFLKHIVSSTQLMEFAAPLLASTLLLDSYPPGAHAVFDCRDVFEALYRPAFRQVSDARVVAFEETNDVILRSGIADLVANHFVRCFEQLVGGRAAADIHRHNLASFQSQWHGIQSISTCAAIATDLFINGRTLSEAIQRFPWMMERAFKRRTSLNIPLLSRAIELSASYLADGLYSADNLEAVLKDALGADKTILDTSYATSTGTRVGLPVATVSDYPSYRVFTNYNGVGTRDTDSSRSIIKLEDKASRVPLWEIVRAATAAPCFFPAKHINGVGTFQDAGLLENDPSFWALAEASALFPHSGQPDFVISLGTGEPAPSNYDIPTSDRRSKRKIGMLRRVLSLMEEKTREKNVRRACKSGGLAGNIVDRYHRLSVEYDGDEPRLDDVSSISEVILKAQADPSLSLKIKAVARCMLASLFYFTLDSDSLPQWRNGKYVLSGHIRCSIRRGCGGPSRHGSDALDALLGKLSDDRGTFRVGDSAVPSNSYLGEDGNFCIPITIETEGMFAITLKLGSKEEPSSNISGSPFSVQKLVAAQGLDAPFGHSDHRKRKRAGEAEGPAKKRRRT
ncbi:hypothetical protein E8E12_000182 [Didymella heteroderae]|uniref:PNPLA domain-containing protein n=1 Tax=Didymella heteroderae TaxID=1769908 RepID=A0A9P4WFE4_9PLEO|nr:hypothetical protein E8E12_000182 [Didymella heteroderae]